MAQTTFANVCPADCSEEFFFQALDTDQNCPGIPDLSQITDIWIKPNTADGAEVPFTAWTDGVFTVTANPTAIDNTVTDNSKVKWMTVIGGIDAAEKVTARVHKFKDVIIKRRFTLSATILNLSNAQYEFLRALQCNPTNYTYWYGNTAHVFGKAEGISPVFTDVDFPLGAGENDYEQAVLTLVFEARVDPERKANPYSDVGNES